MAGYANNMSKLLDKIEWRLGTKPLNLPEDISKDKWADVIKEDTLVKEELNNRYIDSNYDGWKAISIGVIESFMIPEEWEMMESEGIMLITNNGDEIGYAALLGKNRKVQDTHAFFNILAPDQTCTIEREVIDDVLQIDASYFFRAEMEGKSLNRSLLASCTSSFL